MRYSIAAAALVATATASPLIVLRSAPSASAPSGCSTSHSGKFQIQTVNVTTSEKRDLEKRQDGKLLITLTDGTLTDENGRIGNIVANHQFQFDPPPGQAGAIYTSGFSACSNGSLALGGSTIFYQCLSGDFYNIYDESTGAQCTPIYINMLASGTTTGAASQSPDGQPTASPASQISDGQVQATTAAPVTQISDGQVQATTAAAVTQISDGQIQATTGAAVTQISDGQIQATTGAAVSQISDGQIQATTGAAVTQISDGQIQATTGAAVTQISDGQIQATTAAAITQISDGQVQAPTATPISQISDGQVQAPTGNGTVAPTGGYSPPTPTGSPIPYTGAASKASVAGFLAFAGAAIALL